MINSDLEQFSPLWVLIVIVLNIYVGSSLLKLELAAPLMLNIMLFLTFIFALF